MPLFHDIDDRGHHRLRLTGSKGDVAVGEWFGYEHIAELEVTQGAVKLGHYFGATEYYAGKLPSVFRVDDYSAVAPWNTVHRITATWPASANEEAVNVLVQRVGITPTQVATAHTDDNGSDLDLELTEGQFIKLEPYWQNPFVWSPA